jgi:glycolate oxidase FAD binding subunit
MAEGVDPVMVQDVLLAPSAVLWDGSSTWVQLEGHQADVDAQHRALAPVGTFTEVPTDRRDVLPMTLPNHRWSVAPSEIPTLQRAELGGFVAAAGLGLVFAGVPQPPRSVSPQVQAVSDRVKQNFDPTGRLNPGRDAGRK